MAKVAVYNMEGKEVDSIELNDSIFGVEINEHLVHMAVLQQLANNRQGTQKAKTRSEVRGGGRKPWRQKGTGHARQGSTRSPQWTGGGVVFAPVPRDYSFKLNTDDHSSESNRNSYAFWPRLSDREVKNNSQPSTWWMQDGSFFRLKSLEIGYSIPSKALNKVRIDALRIYFSANNLFTSSPFKMWDPEMGDNGLGYPIQQVYNIGLTLNF